MFLILFKTLRLLLKGKYYLYYHFTDKKTESQRGYGTRLGRKPWRYGERQKEPRLQLC